MLLVVLVRYSCRCRRKASSIPIISCGGTWPMTGPRRSTLTDRTCSACAFESTRKPVASAGSRVWNGKTRVTLLVTGTTVTTPRL